jgi:hypothetical protein
MEGGVIATGRMLELMDEYPGGIFCPKEKDTMGITRIGIASVDVKGSGYLSGPRKGAQGRIGAEENRVRFTIGSFEHLNNLRPEVPGNILGLAWTV